MKKLLILCVPISILLCGCSSATIFKPSKPDFDTAYRVNAEIGYGDFTAEADITRNGEDEWEFCFTKPDYLTGMKLSLGDDMLTASLGELSVTAESSDFYRLVPDIIADSVDSLSDIPAEEITEQEGILTLNTEVGGKKVVITADSDGRLLSLLCPYYKVSVDFGEQEPIVRLETLETEDMGGIEIIN